MKTPLRPCLRAALFALPLLLFFGVPAGALWLGGEWMRADAIRALQGARPGELVLHGAAFSNRTILQKVRFIQERKPEVLTLGTSRVLQFRAGFFLPHVRFYNGGSTIQHVVQFRPMLDAIPRAQQPAVLILGLDQYWFNQESRYSEKAGRGEAKLPDPASGDVDRLEMLRQNWWTVDKYLAGGAVDLRQLCSLRGRRDRIGFTALVWDQGTRGDGSYQYRASYSDPADPRLERNFQAASRAIEQGIHPYQFGQGVHLATVRKVADVLAECARRGIMVIGFLPPFSHVMVAKMEAAGDRFAYLAKLDPALRPLFAQHGFELYDFTDAGQVGAPDTETIDGLHGSERTYVRLLEAMLRQGSVLNAYASLPELQQVLEANPANSELVPERF